MNGLSSSDDNGEVVQITRFKGRKQTRRVKKMRSRKKMVQKAEEEEEFKGVKIKQAIFNYSDSNSDNDSSGEKESHDLSHGRGNQRKKGDPYRYQPIADNEKVFEKEITNQITNDSVLDTNPASIITTNPIKTYDDNSIAQIKAQKQKLQSKFMTAEQKRQILQHAEIDVDDIMMSSDESSRDNDADNDANSKKLEHVAAADLVTSDVARKLQIEDVLYEHELDDQDEEVDRWEAQRIKEAVGEEEFANFELRPSTKVVLWKGKTIEEAIKLVEREKEAVDERENREEEEVRELRNKIARLDAELQRNCDDIDRLLV